MNASSSRCPIWRPHLSREVMVGVADRIRDAGEFSFVRVSRRADIVVRGLRMSEAEERLLGGLEAS